MLVRLVVKEVNSSIAVCPTEARLSFSGSDLDTALEGCRCLTV